MTHQWSSSTTGNGTANGRSHRSNGTADSGYYCCSDGSNSTASSNDGSNTRGSWPWYNIWLVHTATAGLYTGKQ